MKPFITALAVLAAIIAISVLGLGTSWFGLVTERPMAKYQMETSRQVYVNSVAHQQGADSGIGIACGNMDNASLSVPERHSYAGIVLATAASYGGIADLSPESHGCIDRAHTLLAQPLPQ